jgi:hypothetical protein
VHLRTFQPDSKEMGFTHSHRELGAAMVVGIGAARATALFVIPAQSERSFSTFVTRSGAFRSDPAAWRAGRGWHMR